MSFARTSLLPLQIFFPFKCTFSLISLTALICTVNTAHSATNRKHLVKINYQNNTKSLEPETPFFVIVLPLERFSPLHRNLQSQWIIVLSSVLSNFSYLFLFCTRSIYFTYKYLLKCYFLQNSAEETSKGYRCKWPSSENSDVSNCRVLSINISNLTPLTTKVIYTTELLGFKFLIFFFLKKKKSRYLIWN